MGAQPAVAVESIAAKTIQKLLRKIIPYVFVLYIVAFLDRINISFAALTMNKALAITSQQFGLLSGIFFFGYFLFEVPSNLLLHRIGARIWIARILITWGIVSMLTAFAQSAVHLYILRFLLGVAEAGFFPGILLYLTYWFRQREQARVVALFMSALAVSSIVGAPASGLILDHVDWFGISSWRWLFILEAAPAIVFGVLTYHLLPSRPAEAGFLTSEEREWITSELAQDEQQKLEQHKLSAVRALAHGRVWHLALVYFTFITGEYSVLVWMPQIVKSLFSRQSNTVIGVLVMIPHLVGLVVMILVSRNSDRSLERRYHAAIPAIVAAIGVLSLTATYSPLLSMALLSLILPGLYSFFGPFWSLPRQFLSGFSAASGIALINAMGNLGGFVGPYAIGVINQKTGALRGGYVVVGASLVLSAVFAMLLPRETRLRSA
jgi:MFS transporter, ACS family, tartrate transporter